MSVDQYSLSGGFWAIWAAQAPIAPELSIMLTATNTVMIYWPSPPAGFHLQVNTDLSTANWSTPPESAQDNGTIKYIIVNPPTGRQFYRLKYP